MNYKFSEKDRLYLSGYFGRDVFDFVNDKRSFRSNIPWGNSTTTLRWNHVFNKRLFANTTAVYNDYKFRFSAAQNNFEFLACIRNCDANLKIDLDYYPLPQHKLKFGGLFTYHKFIPNILSGRQDSVVFNPNNESVKYASEFAVYIQGHGLVTSGHPIASSAGLQILIKGGNAFDAAAAVGAMAALGEPEMNGIGGNGFMTVFHKATNKVWSLSMAGAAPKGLVPAEMTPETLNAGMKAGIVPGNLGGYLSALERFGTMTRRRGVRAGDRVRRAGLSDRSDAGGIDRARPQEPGAAIRPRRRSSCPTASRSRPASC